MARSTSAKTGHRKSSNAMTSDPANLPPYGYIHDEWMYDLRTRRVPLGFRVAGRAADEAAYVGWLEETVDDMADFLWPRYDRASQSWVGKARDNAWAPARRPACGPGSEARARCA